MKKNINNKTTFITICLILSLNGFLFQTNSTTLYAQPNIFLNSHWYLEEGEVDGESISNEDLGNSNFFKIHNTESFEFRYGVTCSEFIIAPYSNVTDNSFLLEPIQGFNSCGYTDPDELASVELHKSLFFELPIDENGTPKNPFNYAYVDNTNNDVDLLITNSNGDWALYQRPMLATSNFNENSFSLYPNPVKETLNLKNSSNQPVTATVYDINGKLLQSLAIENNGSTLDVKTLNQGLYFVIFESESGERVSKKFVKK